MQVILLERVEKLGIMGQVVSVKPGYARNFLLPRGKALRATAENIEYFEKQKATLETQNLKHKQEAQAAAERMSDMQVVIVRQAGESGQLYGSVSARDIADGVTAKGYKINRAQVVIDHPIKTIGMHAVRVQLHPEVAIPLIVNVALSEEEAAKQAAEITRSSAAPVDDAGSAA
jgi:large subunit ribosomal protein L9